MGYEEALRLIEEARETGATKLDLRLQFLTELPPELFQLKQLTEFYFIDNQLTSLPPELFDEANSIKETILDIMNRGAEGAF